jgi:RimJ/RimL family protein N-acetyltransferase
MTAILETERLILRPPDAADIAQFVPLLAAFDVAKNLSSVPHPYTEDDGAAFIALAAKGWESGEDMAFVILRKSDGAYIGTAGLHPKRNWEIGYWLGKPFWGRGYATEAAARAIAYGFAQARTDRLLAKWFHDNPASGHVLAKLGFKPIGEEMSNCLARGHKVPAHVVALDRAEDKTRKKTP